MLFIIIFGKLLFPIVIDGAEFFYGLVNVWTCLALAKSRKQMQEL